jgi:hypothetical protein
MTCPRQSSLALKEAAGAGNGNGLVHHPLADAEVLVDPLGNFLVLAGNFVALETGGPVSPLRLRLGLLDRWGSDKTHVRPVERFTPARKADTVTCKISAHMQGYTTTRPRKGRILLRRTASKA